LDSPFDSQISYDGTPIDKFYFVLIMALTNSLPLTSDVKKKKILQNISEPYMGQVKEAIPVPGREGP
jgi:hypothetical protein